MATDANKKMVLLGTAVVTDVSANPYFGPDGAGGLTSSGTESAVPQFDARPFKQLLFAFEGTWANAVNITLAATVGFQAGTQNIGGISASVAGTQANGLVYLLTGTNISETNSGSSILNTTHTFSPVKAPFFKARLIQSAATGVISNGRLSVFGIL